MWGTYLHRKTTIQFRYKRQENKVKLTHHCSFIRQWILAWCVLHLNRHPSVCSFCMLIHHRPPSAFQQNYILINIHYPHTIFLLYVNCNFFKIYFFHQLDYSIKHFYLYYKSYDYKCTCQLQLHVGYIFA